jgi:glycyl-tRNA synthetase beta chain
MTSMVFEFPGLQGIMGRHYASKQGEPAAVCQALEEQYLPRFAGDRLPQSDCGRLLGLADRLDTLVGIFGVGLKPSGTKDPYGLRRASLSVLRVLIETPLDLDLAWALDVAAEGLSGAGIASDSAARTLEYVIERLPGYYQEQGIEGDVVESVIATGDTNPYLIDRRIRAVSQFRRLTAAESLSAANKRIRNILSKEGVDQRGLPAVRKELLTDPAEQALWSRIQELDQVFGPAIERRDYGEALEVLAGLRDDVDRFFDQVMVMAEDPALRLNRQALLAGVLSRFLDVADVSLLQPGTK